MVARRRCDADARGESHRHAVPGRADGARPTFALDGRNLRRRVAGLARRMDARMTRRASARRHATRVGPASARARAKLAAAKARPALRRRLTPASFRVCGLAHELELALLQPLAESPQIHVARLRLGEHSAALLFFLDVVLDHLPEHRYSRFEVIVVGTGGLDLLDQVRCARVLDLGFMMNVGLVGRFQERWIENLLLDRRVRAQSETDLLRQLTLPVVGASLFELSEKAFDLTMIGLQKRDRVSTRSAVSSSRTPRAAGSPTLRSLRRSRL